MESRYRTVVKALSWRLIATTVTFTITLLLTGAIETAITVGLLDTIIKLSAYYGHERMWMKLNFGKLKSPDYQI